MRALLFLLLCTAVARTTAQPVQRSDGLPAWVHEWLTGARPDGPYTSNAAPLHVNTFIGTWTMRGSNGARIDYWGDAGRMIFREMKDTLLVRTTVVDLTANLRIGIGGGATPEAIIEDLYIPKGGDFRRSENDTVVPTGRTERVMGERCAELVGVDGNGDTTTYWRTDVHPELFADLRAWAVWLCRDGELQYLSAFSDPNAGASLRVAWKARQYGAGAGSMAFERITPGKEPMPLLRWRPATVQENRFAWTNNHRMGRLPLWMRERMNPLPEDPRTVGSTPEAVDRGILDNTFIGTFTAERRTPYIGQKKDTTVRVARYRYWAGPRRAILRLDAPDDQRIVTYMVDLDADVLVTCVDEMSSAIPKLYINTLEKVGLSGQRQEREMDLRPTGSVRTIAGHPCEQYMSGSAPGAGVWLSDVPQGPVPDLARWSGDGFLRYFKDLLLFGLKDRPMPFAIGSLEITAIQLGPTAPPPIDLTNYRVNDSRLERR